LKKVYITSDETTFYLDLKVMMLTRAQLVTAVQEIAQLGVG
jgi:hypothetical protein